MTCFLCSDEWCGGFGCGGDMPSLPANDLMSMRLPRLCVTCEQQPALIGDGSNYCEECTPKSIFQWDGDEVESHTLEASVAYLGGHVSRHGDAL